MGWSTAYSAMIGWLLGVFNQQYWILVSLINNWACTTFVIILWVFFIANNGIKHVGIWGKMKMHSFSCRCVWKWAWRQFDGTVSRFVYDDQPKDVGYTPSWDKPIGCMKNNACPVTHFSDLSIYHYIYLSSDYLISGIAFKQKWWAFLNLAQSSTL